MSFEAARRYWVSGRVQGVFFRASTAEFANTIGVHGDVRNLPDGRVEVFAYGDTEKLNELSEWLQAGPERAEVSRVEFVDVSPEELSAQNCNQGFRVSR